MHEIQELLKERGADMLAGQINVDLILSIIELNYSAWRICSNVRRKPLCFM